MALAGYQNVRVVSVGDGSVVETFQQLSLGVGEHIPVTMDIFSAGFMVDHKPIGLTWVDTTSGSPGLDRDRINNYTGTDCVVIIFSVMNRASLENIRDRWVPEALQHCSGAPIILVGNKIDLRDDVECIESLKAKKQTPISTEEGQQLCTELKLVEYIETSALTQHGLRHLFQQAMRYSVKKQAGGFAPKKETCVLQ